MASEGDRNRRSYPSFLQDGTGWDWPVGQTMHALHERLPHFQHTILFTIGVST